MRRAAMEQTQEKHSDSHVLESPAWLLGIRFAQILLSLICFGLGAGVVHDAYLDELGLNVAMVCKASSFFRL